MKGTPSRFGIKRTILTVAVCAIAAIPIEQANAGEGSALSWRGRPLPYCKSFLLTEFGLYGKLSVIGEPTTQKERGLPYATADIGWMKNVSRKYAVGATVFGGTDEEVVRLGARARVRRWIEPNLALDLAPGVVVTGTEGGYDYPGFTGQLAVSFGDWASIATQVEIIPTKERVFIPPSTFTTKKGNETVWYAGAKLGSYPGAVAVVVVPLALLAIFAASFESF